LQQDAPDAGQAQERVETESRGNVQEPESHSEQANQPESTAHIDDLSPLPMLDILDKLPLYDLLMHIGKVSPLWKYWQARACRVRRRIVLLLGEQAEKFLRESFDEDIELINALQHPSFSENAVNLLVDMLPNVNTLQVSLDRIETPVVDQL